jgi:hypothetical protein
VVTPGTWLTVHSANSLEASLDTVPESVTSLWMVVTVIRSFFNAFKESNA